MSEELGTEITIDRVDLKFIDNVELEGVYIADQEGDTLLYAPRIYADVKDYSLKRKFFDIGKIELAKPRIKIRKYMGRSEFNYDFLVDYFTEEDEDTTPSNWEVNILNVHITDAIISYRDEDEPKAAEGFDENNIVAHVDLHISDIQPEDDVTKIKLHHLGIKDRSGLHLKNLSGDITILPGGINLLGMDLSLSNSRLVADEFELKGKSWDDFSDFVDKVRLDLHLKPGSHVHMSDIVPFVPDLKGIKEDIKLTGQIKGTISHLKSKNLEFILGSGSHMKGDFDFSGLPNFEDTFMAFNIREFHTTKEELERIELPPFDGSTFVELPANVGKLGNIELNGNLMGFYTDFVAFANITTDIGNVGTDIEMRYDSAHNNFLYEGMVRTENFNIGYMDDIPGLGAITANIEIDTGYGLSLDHIYAEIGGDIGAIHVNGYTYNNVKINHGALLYEAVEHPILGHIPKNGSFKGDIHIRDPHITLDYLGVIDFTNPNHPKFDFDAYIRNAHLADINLNILEGTPDASLCADIKVENARGASLDNFTGIITVSDLSYHEERKDVEMRLLKVMAEHNGDMKTLRLRSDMGEADINGAFEFSNLQHSFLRMASSIMPALIPPEEVYGIGGEDVFDFSVHVEDISFISELYDLPFSIRPGTYLEGNYDSFYDEFHMTCFSDAISYDQNSINDLMIKADKTDDIMLVDLMASKVLIDAGTGIKLENYELSLTPWQDNLRVTTSWKNSEKDKGSIKGDAFVFSPEKFEFYLDETNFSVLDQHWHVEPNGIVKVDKDTVEIRNILVRAEEDEAVIVNGRISENVNDTLHVSLDKFKLKNFNPFIALDGYDFYGDINGDVKLFNLLDDVPKYTTDWLNVDSLRVNNSYVGDVFTSGQWVNETKSLLVDGSLVRGEHKTVQFAGDVYPLREKEQLDLTIDFEDTDLGVVNEFLPQSDVSEFHAYALGQIRVTGEFENVDLNGNLVVEEGQVKVNYLNTRYRFDGEILVEPRKFIIDNFNLFDEESYYLDLPPNGAVQGVVNHLGFDTISYDVHVGFDRLMVLNTDYTMNPLFYGKVFASGYATIADTLGENGKIEVDVEATSEKGTVFSLPLYGADEVVLEDFVRFISDDSMTVEDYEVDLEDYRLNFGLNVNENADVQIIFDPAIGDVMTGSAKGRLNMNINELGQFLMDGTLEVVRGEYLFQMYNVVNKLFTVEPGGTILWTGDPYDAIIDLTTTYTTKAPLSNLVTLDDDKYDKKYKVNCSMNLKNDLYNPEIGFNITIPESVNDQNIQAALNKVVNDEEELTKQFFSLMVINSFISSGSGTDVGTGAFNATTADLLNAKVGDLLNEISEDVELGFNYSPGDELTEEELAVAFETQLFNERLLISGEFGYAQTTSATASNTNLIGDFAIEYKVNEDGTFRVKGFNETNDYDITNSSQSRYTQGVGLSYTEDFDKIRDTKLFTKLRKLFKRNKKKKDKNNANKDGIKPDEQPSAGS